MEAVILGSGEEGVPLSVLSRQLKTTRSKKVDSFKLSREARPNPSLPSTQNENGWVFTEEMFQRVARVKFFTRDQKDRYKIAMNSTAWYAKSIFLCVMVGCMKSNAIKK